MRKSRTRQDHDKTEKLRNDDKAGRIKIVVANMISTGEGGSLTAWDRERGKPLSLGVEGL